MLTKLAIASFVWLLIACKLLVFISVQFNKNKAIYKLLVHKDPCIISNKDGYPPVVFQIMLLMLIVLAAPSHKNGQRCYAP